MGYGRVYKIYTYINEYLIDVLYSLLDVIHKYRYSNHLDYKTYHTWLQANS